MKKLWKRLTHFLLYLFAAVVFMGQKTPAPIQETRADSPGFAVLAEAKRLKSDHKFPAAAIKAIGAGRLFKEQADWVSWAACYEEAYQCTRACDSTGFYHSILDSFAQAVSDLSTQSDLPPVAKATIWGRTGFLHHCLGAYDQAIEWYEKAFPFVEQTADTAYLLRLYGSAAMLIWDRGDDFRAMTYHEKALGLAIAQRDTGMMAAITTNLANVYRTADPPKAVPTYRSALALDPENSETLMLLSKAYLEIEKNNEQALQTARQALRFARDDYARADALHQLGRVDFERHRYEDALGYYHKATTYATRGYGPHHPECAKIHTFSGHAWLAMKEFDRALFDYNQTLDDLLPLFTPASADQIPRAAELTTQSLWVMEALLGKARVYEQMFQQHRQPADLERALACSERALDYLNKIKLQYGDDRSKFAINDYVQGACASALHAAVALYRATGNPAFAHRAFALSEQTKGVVLAEALYRKEIKRIAGVPVNLLEQGRQFSEQIAFFENKLSDSKTSNWKDSLFYVRRRQEDLEKQLAANYPAYGEALLGYKSAVSVDTVRGALPADAALLEYFLGDSVLYIFLLTNDTFWVQEQALPAQFNNVTGAFLHSVSDWQYATDSTADANRKFLDAAWQLYEWLLERPLALTNKPRLFIVPDGVINYLPFDLLLTRPYAGQWIDRDVPFLLKDKAVSYRFSCKPNPVLRSAAGWGGFGTEYDDNTLSAIDAPGAEAPVLAMRNSGRLPYADDEVLAIANILGGAFWLNERATKANFLENAEQYGILHLAMHGFVDPKDPLRSRLLFSKSLAGDDPFVYASDLYALQLTAGLAVLSACQSGVGTWKRGEGVMSLARAFAFAGCPSMVMSLWNVSDRSTSELMIAFYKELKAGKTKDEALRLAKLRYLRTVTPEYAKPVYWAGFVPVGEMEMLPESYFSDGGRGWVAWLLGALGVAGLFWILLLRFRQKA